MRVVDICVKDVNELVQVVFSGLFPMVIECADEGERIVVWARTPKDTAVRPVCGALSGRVHGYHWQTVADVPVGGRRVVVRVRVRGLVCPTRGCRHTFREQVPRVLERYQRRRARLTKQVKSVVKELVSRAGARLLAILAVGLSRHTALRALLRIRTFAQLLKPPPGNADTLEPWITQVRAADLPHPHFFTRGLERDRDAVIAAFTLPYSNGPTKGVNKTKLIARQMHGRAGFTLLRHHILLEQRHAPSG